MPATSRSGGNRTIGQDKTPEDGGPVRPTMPKDVGKKYDELLSQIQSSILRKCDVHELLTIARLLVQGDRLAAALEAEPLDHKTARVYQGVVDRVHRLSAAFGLSPADRKRLCLDTEEEVDELEEFNRS
jgi:hypothetical protein